MKGNKLITSKVSTRSSKAKKTSSWSALRVNPVQSNQGSIHVHVMINTGTKHNEDINQYQWPSEQTQAPTTGVANNRMIHKNSG